MIPSQMLKGVLEGCMLAIISSGETYGYEIVSKLKDFGFGEVSEGTIYPILLRLEKSGQIAAVLKPSALGPKRKYYHITEAGAKGLSEFCQNWKVISSAVNQTLGGNGDE